MKILEFNVILVFLFAFIMLGVVSCNSSKNDLQHITSYLQANEFNDPSDLNWLPLPVKWENKTEKYWIGSTILRHGNDVHDTCRVLALFRQQNLEKLQFTCDRLKSDFNGLSNFELIQPNNGELIKAHLNSSIYPYKVWEFEGQKPFWLQVGQSNGARSGSEFYCFYFSLDCLIDNL